ncbi:aminoglycoside adenylyltransferase domain-containing protein, partial [Streptomyces nigra]
SRTPSRSWNARVCSRTTGWAGRLPADNRVLNGCRAVRHRRTGRWEPKRAAARAVAVAEERFRPLVEAAMRSYEQPSRTAAVPLPAERVREFLAWVAGQVAGADAP